jgi:predicted phosphoribosyltransferase
MVMRFRDRNHAGELLAHAMRRRGLPHGTDPVVLGLPRGGVPVARVVARDLRLPLDVFVVRKLGLPGQEELAMGAIASGGVRVLNREVVDALEISSDLLDAVTSVEREELERREGRYRGGRPPVPVSGRAVVLVDDGIATGSTVRAAVIALRRLEPDSIVVAAPVVARVVATALRRVADDLVAVIEPDQLVAVGWWYEDFTPTTDEDVRAVLDEAEAEERAEAPRHA